MGALIVFCGALCSTLGTLALRQCANFRNPRFTALALAGYGGSTFFLSKAMAYMPVALAHAAWSGVVALALLAMDVRYLKARLARAQAAGFFCILAGIAILGLTQ